MTNTLDCLSWEPRILKHGAHYDDPWVYRFLDKSEYRPHASVAKRKPVLIYDSKTLKITDHISLAVAAASIKADPGQIRQSAKNGWLIQKRYACGYTIAELLENIKKYGWS